MFNYIRLTENQPLELPSSLVIWRKECESFHSHSKDNFYTTSPSIFLFLETLKNVPIDIYISLNSVGNLKTRSTAIKK